MFIFRISNFQSIFFILKIIKLISGRSFRIEKWAKLLKINIMILTANLRKREHMVDIVEGEFHSILLVFSKYQINNGRYINGEDLNLYRIINIYVAKIPITHLPLSDLLAGILFITRISSNFQIQMDDLKDKSIHHTTIKICEDLKKSTPYLSLYEDIQVSF